MRISIWGLLGVSLICQLSLTWVFFSLHHSKDEPASTHDVPAFFQPQHMANVSIISEHSINIFIIDVKYHRDKMELL